MCSAGRSYQYHYLSLLDVYITLQTVNTIYYGSSKNMLYNKHSDIHRQRQNSFWIVV